MRSMTDEGVKAPTPVPAIPHPTFAGAKATLSRKRERERSVSSSHRPIAGGLRFWQEVAIVAASNLSQLGPQRPRSWTPAERRVLKTRKGGTP